MPVGGSLDGAPSEEALKIAIIVRFVVPIGLLLLTPFVIWGVLACIKRRDRKKALKEEEGAGTSIELRRLPG
jgi:hypothetical protein